MTFNPISQIQSALESHYGQDRLDELREKLIEEFGHDRYRNIYRIALIRIGYKPDYQSAAYVEAFAIRRNLP